MGWFLSIWVGIRLMVKDPFGLIATLLVHFSFNAKTNRL